MAAKLSPLGPRVAVPKKPPQAPRTAKDLITKKAAIDLVAARVHVSFQKLRVTENKVRGTVDRAINSGKLKMLPGKRLVVGDFLTWARTIRRWESALDDLPFGTTVGIATGSPSGAKFGTPIAMTGNLAESQWALVKAIEYSRELEQLNADLAAEVAVLRPLATKYEAIQAKAKVSGSAKKPRR